MSRSTKTSNQPDWSPCRANQIQHLHFQYKHLPVVAGLGYKAKEAKKKAKPRTLQEKREQMESDVNKYGREAVSKMYAAEDEAFADKRKTHHRHRSTPIKMKPKPTGFNFEEKSARAILRPFSHHKYIHEPPMDTVVYISRRNGIVPLFR